MKDNFETQGIVTAIGMTEHKGVVSSHDATLVRHVRGMGGILLGKSSCPPGAVDSSQTMMSTPNEQPLRLVSPAGGK